MSVEGDSNEQWLDHREPPSDDPARPGVGTGSCADGSSGVSAESSGSDRQRALAFRTGHGVDARRGKGFDLRGAPRPLASPGRHAALEHDGHATGGRGPERRHLARTAPVGRSAPSHIQDRPRCAHRGCAAWPEFMGPEFMGAGRDFSAGNNGSLRQPRTLGHRCPEWGDKATRTWHSRRWFCEVRANTSGVRPNAEFAESGSRPAGAMAEKRRPISFVRWYSIESTVVRPPSCPGTDLGGPQW